MSASGQASEDAAPALSGWGAAQRLTRSTGMEHMTSVQLPTAVFIVVAVAAVWLCLPRTKQLVLLFLIVAAAFFATRFLTTV
jgi:hypothetical protein